MTEQPTNQASDKPDTPQVERLFPFALRARVIVVGESLLMRLKKKLHFILVTEDISQHRVAEICRQYSSLPILQCYSVEDIETHFGFRNTKVLGFKKGSLAVSIHKELKKTAKRLNPGSGQNTSANSRTEE